MAGNAGPKKGTSIKEAQPEGTFELFRVAVSLSDESSENSSPLTSIRAAIIRVKFPRPFCNFSYYRMKSNASMGNFCKDSGCTQGLTRLVCNNSEVRRTSFRIFESVRISKREKTLRRLLPLGSPIKNSSRYRETIRMLLESAEAIVGQPVAGPEKGCLQDYIAVLPLDSLQKVVTNSYPDVHMSRRQTISASSLDQCTLRFLMPEEQILKHPIELRQDERGGGSTRRISFVGEVPLSKENKTGSFVNCEGDQISKNAVDSAQTVLNFAKHRKDIIARASRIWEDTMGITRQNHSEPMNPSGCVRMPSKQMSVPDIIKLENQQKTHPGVETSPGVMSLAETAAKLFVEGEEGMAHTMTSLVSIGMLSPDLGGVIMGPTKDIAKDFSQMAAGTMADQAAGVSEAKSAGQVDQAMTEQITQLLSRGLKSHLTESLATPLKETITASVSGSTTQSFQSSLSRILTRDLRRPLMEQITEHCTKKLPSYIDEKISTQTARLLIRDVNHLLTRSLPHALVPALVHTLTHSPLQDYYCYYCFHHKVFCQYCTYAPQQLYYAMYYAGYYSTFYGDYFGDHVMRQLSADMLQKRKMREEALGIS